MNTKVMGKTQNIAKRSAFGKIISMKRLKDEGNSMLVKVRINYFSPSPILCTKTKNLNVVFQTNGEIYFNSKYGAECMNLLEQFTEEEIKLKSNSVAEKYFTGKIIDEIASDIYTKTSIISAYPLRF